MADNNQETTPQNPGQTGDAPAVTTPPAAPTATAPEQGGGAATGDDEMVTMSKKDRDALVASRDRNYEQSAQQSAFIESMAQKEGINNFLKDNKDKYPDLSFDDLSHVSDPAQLDAEASRIQTRLQEHAQAKILEIENPQRPRQTPEERAQIEADLAKNPDGHSLEKMIAGRMSA